MTIRNWRSTSLVLAVAGSLALVGCSGGSNPEPTPTVTSTPSATPTPTPSSSPTPTPSSAGEKAAADAVVSYIRTYDRLGADPASDLIELLNVARGDALAQAQYNLSSYRGQGWRVMGERLPVFVASVPGSDANEWFVTMCVDVSQVDVLDSSGVSVKNVDAPDRFAAVYTASADPQSRQWFVTKEETTGAC
nr:hypothetical protein [Propionicimonas sp.]